MLHHLHYQSLPWTHLGNCLDLNWSLPNHITRISPRYVPFENTHCIIIPEEYPKPNLPFHLSEEETGATQEIRRSKAPHQILAWQQNPSNRTVKSMRQWKTGKQSTWSRCRTHASMLNGLTLSSAYGMKVMSDALPASFSKSYMNSYLPTFHEILEQIMYAQARTCGSSCRRTKSTSESSLSGTSLSPNVTSFRCSCTKVSLWDQTNETLQPFIPLLIAYQHFSNNTERE